MDTLYLSLPEMISTSLKWTEDKSNSNVVTESAFRRQCKQTQSGPITAVIRIYTVK